MIRTGLDIFTQNPSISGRVGLLANVASTNRFGQTALTALQEAGVEIAAIFSPEHGYFGLGSAGEAIPDSRYGEALPIYSLYGTNNTPPSELLRGLDAVIIDLQDTGNRWYTFAYTMRAMLKACAGVGCPVLVLDRPNPQGGITVEGATADPEFFSMVAPAALPARYGLTFGELARFFNDALGANLFVIAMDGWRRDMLWADTGLRWSAPSPGMPHAQTALLYSGTCLIEGTNLSEGRGTALPFEQIGAPYIRGEVLTDALNALELPGVAFSPVWFMPQSSKYTGQRCEGVRLHLIDPYAVRGFALGIQLLSTIRELYPEAFDWHYYQDKNTFETLTATRFIRAMLDSGQPPEDILALCDEQAEDFQSHSAAFWLYDE
jgi:uncharacterized protein YbbC (DUF1343 family)